MSACFPTNQGVTQLCSSDRKSRPVTPLTSPLEEYFSESSMASGDESDDEDLTEPDDCDSDTEGEECLHAPHID